MTNKWKKQTNIKYDMNKIVNKINVRVKFPSV